MCASYDEDLGDNPLFQTFKKEYSDLFFKVISEGCTICVPRAGSLPSFSITLDDILAHVIYPSEEMPESHFITLSGKDVKVCNRFVTIESDGECIVSTKVLFEETYYSDDFLKYKVLCIENPLEPKDGVHSDGLVELKSLRDCIEFILTYSNEMNLLDDLNKEIEDFNQQDELFINSSIQTLKDLTIILCDKCLQIALKSKLLRQQCYQNSHNVKNLKLAIETYVHHGIFKELFKFISMLKSQENSVLNKIIRNSLDINLRDMEIKAEYHNLIPKAKLELGKISGYSSLLGKFNCVQKMMSVISRDPESGGLLAADDLLPIIIFVIIKTDILNWAAQLTYLKHFRYANNLGDENEFFVTTLEAAIEHIKSGIFIDSFTKENDKVFMTDLKEKLSGINYLFQQIANGDIIEVKKILTNEENHLHFDHLKLCHPLCDCKNCKLIILKSSKNCHPTVNSFNDSGLSALLVASIHGQPLVLDYLISLNADLQHADENGLTALHHAASKGHQHVILLLSQAGADVNCLDNFQNTPLHFCCLNGHESCVKAVIYHSENESLKLLINAQNINGDTPLHHAAKYGFISIVQILIENNADPSVLNNRKLNAFKVANNNKITEILKKAKPRYQSGATKITNFDFSEDKTINNLIPNSPELIKKVDKMLKAIFYGDINLACFYLGLNPILKIKVCHPLCDCLKCSKPDDVPQTSQVLNINMCNNGGLAALHFATLYGHFDLVKLLLKNGANINLQTRNLLSPLIISCQQKRVKIAKYFLDAGCDVNLQDIRGNTALHHACMLTHGRLVEIILNYKPKLSLRNKGGRTPVQEAENKLALGIVNMLRECNT